MALRQFCVAGIRLHHQHCRVLQAHQSVEMGIDLINTLQISLHHLHATDFFGMNGFGEFVGAEFGDNHA